MPKVDIGSVHLDYMEAGTGDHVVFVHGTLNDWRAWGLQIEAFSQRYHVVAYTRRHHFGSEDQSSRSHSVTSAANDLISVLERLDLTPTHLVGHSYGAFTVLLAASKRPDLVRSLVLCEPPIAHLLTEDPSTQPIWQQFEDQAFRAGQRLVAEGKTEGGIRTFVDGVVGKGGYDQLPAPVMQLMSDNAKSFEIEESPREPFSHAEASRVIMPALLVQGDRSPQWFHTILERLHGLLPHAERVVIPNASHGMQGDNPEAFNTAVLEFLGKQ